jgi:hypothetical protein
MCAVALHVASTAVSRGVVEVLRSIDLVTLPVDPQRMRLLSRASGLMRAGTTGCDLDFAAELNNAVRLARQPWISARGVAHDTSITNTPGSDDSAPRTRPS